jgi:hypothetical protein
MAEDSFYLSQSNRFRGGRYPSFGSGGIDAQGNITGVAQTSNPGLLESSGSPTSAATSGLTQVDTGSVQQEIPSVGEVVKNAAIGSALPYAGQVIGSTTGAAIAGGSTFGEGIKQGASALGSKISGLFSSGAGEAAGSAAGSVVSGAAGTAAGAASTAANTASNGTFGGRLTSGSNLGGAAGAGVGAAAATLLTGGDVKKAAGAGLGTAAGTAIGNAVLPGIGGIVGGMIGGAIGGRVICTQLVREGMLSPEDQYLDMEFTFRHLSNVHARGYLYWARSYVNLMKRHRWLLRPTRAIVVWRLNEIKYQLGRSPRPCLRGKMARWTLEPMCYAIGLFLADTVETRIYKKELTSCTRNPA